MIKKSQQSYFHIFLVLLSLFIIAFINLWSKGMMDETADTADNRWLFYAVYLLVGYSAYIWVSNFEVKMRGIHLTCLLWCFIMPVFLIFNHAAPSHIAQAILWPLLFEAAYLFTKQSRKNVRLFHKYFILVAIYGGFFFLQSRLNIASLRLAQSNTIYFPFLALPFLLLVKDKRLRLLILIFFTVLGVWSLKRSVMLALVFIWAAYVVSLLKGGHRSVKFFLIVLLTAGGSTAYSYGDELLGGQITERVNSEETDEGRNRLAIYAVTWAMIQSSSSQELIFGHGHFGVRRDSILEISAHNDFLEVIYDYGLLIFALYLLLWGHVIWRCIKLYRSDYELFLPYAVSLAIFLVMSMVSHLILYTSYFNYLVLFWGMTEGYLQKTARLKMLAR